MSEVSQSDVESAYRRYAPIYDLLFGAVLNPGRVAMAKAVNASPPKALLEIGVGTGLALKYYPLTTHITGIDLSADMLSKAHAEALKLQTHHISLKKMNAEYLDFDDASFDCVTIPYVLSVTPNPSRLVSEARRVCTPTGTIFIVNHFSGAPGWATLEKVAKPFADRIGFRSEFDFNKEILSYDWTITDCKPVNLFKLSRLVTIRNG